MLRRDDDVTDGKTTLAQRHRGSAAVRTSTAHPTQETAGGVLPNRRTAGSRLPTELQTTAGEDECRTPSDYPRNCRRLLGRMSAVHHQLDGERQLQPVVRRITGEGGPSAGPASSLRACFLRVGRTGLPALHRLGRRELSPPWQHQRQDPVDRVCARPRTLLGSTNSRLEGLL